jgi:cardiolipin synthase
LYVFFFFLFALFFFIGQSYVLMTCRYLVAATTIWSGLSYVFSKDAVKILSHKEIQQRIARASKKEDKH